MMNIILAIVLGLAFGIALDQAKASNPQKIIGMLRLKDFHLMKVILFAIGFSSLLLFILSCLAMKKRVVPIPRRCLASIVGRKCYRSPPGVSLCWETPC